MPLKVTFVENWLKMGNRKIVKVVKGQTVGFERILSDMAATTATDVHLFRAGFEHFIDALMYRLSQGETVVTPLGSLSLTVHVKGDGNANGGPSSASDGIILKLRTDRKLLARLRSGTKVQIVDPPTPRGPCISTVRNLNTGDGSAVYSPGNIMEIRGNLLSFKSEDEECGVFLVSTDGQGVARCTLYTRNGSAIVDCQIPDLPAGEYAVEIRTRPSRRVLRVGRSDTVIQIEPD